MQRIIIAFFICTSLLACKPEVTNSNDNYDRAAMLINLSDNIIIPAFTDYSKKTEALATATELFLNERNRNNLTTLREAWLTAYTAWQWVGMYTIGPSETLGLDGYTNTFPTDTTEINKIINKGGYNLALPSRRNQQGFPAIDYLINGLNSDDTQIIESYNDEKYRNFLSEIVTKINDQATEVLSEWNKGYRDTFVESSGSDAASSVNKIVNDYIFYFEKRIRTDKIATPAGQFTGNQAPASVEGYYYKNISRSLYLTSLDAAQQFFNGQHFGSSQTGESFATYLVYLKSATGIEDLVTPINSQLDELREDGKTLSEDLGEQVTTDNSKMTATFDALQELVVLLKVDMVQAMTIRVDYTDTDGD